ncbi:MAG TPA: LysR family transcriptional regulator [Burkholderiales bacterium]|nr:LysR family transcriptional regulator [Burkholderiales bacterium]
MSDLNEMLVFSAVASGGSFIGASRALGIPKATVSRKVQDLEARLGVRLLQRTTRRISLTEAGRAFQEHCLRIQAEVEDAEATVSRLRGTPRGLLKVSAPYTLASILLIPVLPEFLARHPNVTVALTLRSDFADLIAHDTDVALTALPLPDSSYAARVLATTTLRLYASPAYLRDHGVPARPGDLSPHAALVFSPLTRPGAVSWALESGGRRVEVPLRPVLQANDMAPIRTALLAGSGIALMAKDLLKADVEAGRLQPVLPEWSGPTLEVRAVYASRRGLLPRVRLFLDFLVETTLAIKANA